MNTIKLEKISVEKTKREFPNIKYIDNDLVLIEDATKIKYANEPRRVTCKCFGLCTQGTAEYTLNTVKHTLRSGDIIIINNGQVISDYHQSDDFEGIALQISDAFFYEIFSSVHGLSMHFTFSRLHPVFHLNSEEKDNIITYFNLIKDKVAQTEHHFRRDTVRSLLQALIYDTAESIANFQQNSTMKNSRAETIFVSFIQKVEENFRDKRRVSWYARSLNITAKYLSETIKQVSMRTPNDWIDDYVVLEIRVLLRNSTKSIKEIAEYMNFPNQSFFGKYFKEHVGMSPSEYRKR